MYVLMVIYRYIYEKYGGFQVLKVESIGDCELLHMRAGKNELMGMNDWTAMRG